MRDSDKPMSQREAYQRGYAAGYAAAQSGPPREPTRAMLDAGTLVYIREQQKRIPKWEPVIAARFWRAMHDAWAQEQTGGETQRASEQANADQAGVAPGPPDHIEQTGGPIARGEPINQPELRSGPPDHQSAATPSNLSGGSWQEGADGPAADPLSHAWKSGYAQAKEEDELAQRFCPHCNPCQHDGDERCRAPAADPSPVDYRYLFTDPITRVPIWPHESLEWNGQHPVRSEPLYSADALKRLRAERDTLAAIVRAADAMHLKPTMDNINAWLEARAKWEGKP